MICGYTSAKDFFDAVRDAAVERERTASLLSAQRARADLHAQRYDRPMAGGVSDPMAPVDELVEMERLYSERLAADEALLRKAAELLYGVDGRGGVAALLGSETADLMFWRYCDAKKWASVAAAMKRSRAWCASREAMAFDLIDSLGSDRVIGGDGCAED